MGERVEETAGGHERFLGGNGDVVESGGGVLLEDLNRGVKGFGDVADGGGGIGDDRAAIRVRFGD